ILGRAQIAIFPYADSLISRSKNSVKLLELMAAGCAVIASNVGDVPAVTGASAVLVEGSDPSAFASATIDLWHNAERIRWLSSSAQHRALNQFCLPNVTRLLLGAYRNAGVLPPCSHV
ncbi:MAG: glycosyltransferase, partial [Chloroflexota bacterium]|nr:glycosyltransferase [Chloroflexota bacterium]